MRSWTRCGFVIAVLGLMSTGSTCLCSNPLTLLAKLANDQRIGDLTACEWKAVFQNLPALAGALNIDLQGATIPELTDAQAELLVTFLDDHQIDTFQQLLDAINSGAITEADVPPDLWSLVPPAYKN